MGVVLCSSAVPVSVRAQGWAPGALNRKLCPPYCFSGLGELDPPPRQALWGRAGRGQGWLQAGVWRWRGA